MAKSTLTQRLAALLAAVVLGLPGCAGPVQEVAAPADSVPVTYEEAFPAQYVTTSRRAGVRQPFLFMRPQDPVASVILFSGGEGVVGISPAGVKRPGNFLVRTRRWFAQQGFQVAVVDPPSDRWSLEAFRIGEGHALDIKGVIAYLREQANVPVWLIGTSYGTVSAIKVADRLADGGGPDGVVLTSSLFRRGRAGDSVFDADPARIRVPLLVVHHRQDRCPATPFAAAPGYLERFTAAPAKELLPFEGGGPLRGGVCEPFDHHGFVGIERPVVDAIGAWIKTHPTQ
jgi:pimeloyl-ACP methyl ester carboxylesterase